MFLYLKKNAYDRAAAREKEKGRYAVAEAEAEKAAASESRLVNDDPRLDR